MIAVSVSVEGVGGLTWLRCKRLIAAIEQLGFAGLYCSDHFVLPEPVPTDSLEMVLALGYLADHTQRVHFGPLVSPLSFRDPVMLARQAAALDNLSDGRMILADSRLRRFASARPNWTTCWWRRDGSRRM